jgi:hypothetical protein
VIDKQVEDKALSFKGYKGKLRWVIACVIEMNVEDAEGDNLEMVSEVLDTCREYGSAKIVDVQLVTRKGR